MTAVGKNTGLEKDLSKAEKKVRRLYALVWLLACPLVFVLARLLGFSQINIVYWTLLVVPVLLAVYNVRQVPPLRTKPATAHTMPPQNGVEDAGTGAEEDSAETGVSHVKRAQLTALALRIPVIIAAPILITLIVDLIVGLQK